MLSSLKKLLFQAFASLYIFTSPAMAGENDSKVYEQLNLFGEAFDRIKKLGF